MTTTANMLLICARTMRRTSPGTPRWQGARNLARLLAAELIAA